MMRAAAGRPQGSIMYIINPPRGGFSGRNRRVGWPGRTQISCGGCVAREEYPPSLHRQHRNVQPIREQLLIHVRCSKREPSSEDTWLPLVRELHPSLLTLTTTTLRGPPSRVHYMYMSHVSCKTWTHCHVMSLCHNFLIINKTHWNKKKK